MYNYVFREWKSCCLMIFWMKKKYIRANEKKVEWLKLVKKIQISQNLLKKEGIKVMHMCTYFWAKK